MKKYKRSISELNIKLKEQLQHIEDSIESYDRGLDIAAQKIVVALRILFSDTKNSKSLLTNLSIKSDMLIISSVSQYWPTNLIPFNELIVTEAKFTNVESSGKWIPRCHTDIKLPNKWLQANDWWNEIVFDDKVTVFSRRDIVLTVADKEGGAHVDTELTEEFVNLTINNSLGATYGYDDVPLSPFDKNPAYVCIRQIAHEVIFSFQTKNQIKSYTRSKTGEEVTIAFIDDKNYFHQVNSEIASLFDDSRVTKTEKRKVYNEVLIHNNGAVFSQPRRVFSS